MMQRIRAIALIGGCLVSVPVFADDAATLAGRASEAFRSGKLREGVDLLDQALDASWSAQELHFRKAVFAKAPAQGYGVYQAREAGTFKKGAPILVYAEPVGFSWEPRGELYRASLVFDAELLDEKESRLTKVEGVQTLDLESREQNREFFLDLNLSLNDAPPGKYIWRITARDQLGGKQGGFSLPFEIAE